MLRALRERKDKTPVIVLTARDAVGDRVAGLDAGADDYPVKPFELDEPNARMRAVLRRHAGRGEPVLRARRAQARPGDAPGHARRNAGGAVGASRGARGAARPARRDPVAGPASRTACTAGARRSRATRSPVYIHQLRRNSAPTRSATCAASATTSASRNDPPP